MADVHDKVTRSLNMSRIRSKDTKPELTVRRFLFNKGFRYRTNDKGLPGKPDIVLKKYNTIVLVHGCFWHGHKGCKDFVMPKTNTSWWAAKINRNIQNDEKVVVKLMELGWNIIIIWECMLKRQDHDKVLNTLVKNIKQNVN